MSVLKRKRKESRFEVIHHYFYIRKEVTDLALRDFGYSREKADKKIQKMFKGKPYEELSESDKQKYLRYKERDDAFDEWFVVDERTAILGILRDLGRNLFSANTIRPIYFCELEQRRLYQEKAIADCEALKQELQYTIQTLPVDINKFTRFADMLDKEVSLIKGWRKSDNSFKKTAEEEEAKRILNIDKAKETLLEDIKNAMEDVGMIELDDDQMSAMEELREEYEKNIEKKK